MRYLLVGLAAVALTGCMGQPPMDQPSGEPVEQIAEPTDGAANEIGTE